MGTMRARGLFGAVDSLTAVGRQINEHVETLTDESAGPCVRRQP